MTAKEYLQQLRTIDMQLRNMESQLYKLHQDIYCLQATDYSKDKIMGGKQVDIGDKVARINDEADKINAAWDRLIDLRIEARGRIERLPNAHHRIVLIERYINVKTWEQVAEIIEYTYRRTTQLHGEALAEFAKTFPIISHS